jgi:hypothetical protein
VMAHSTNRHTIHGVASSQMEEDVKRARGQEGKRARGQEGKSV